MDQKATIDTRNIEDALVKLLMQITKERQRTRPPSGSFQFTPYQCRPAAELKTRDQSAVDMIIETPVEAACLVAVRLLGQRPHDMGLDVEGMETVASRVCSRSRRHSGRWLAVLNSRWNCIGDWAA